MHFLEELQRGADGVVTGFSFPEILLKVYALHRQGEQEEAARVFDRYCSLIRYEFQPLVALALQRDGLIRYARGRIEVLDREGLEERACECYAVVKLECDRLLPQAALDASRFWMKQPTGALTR